MGWYGHYNSKLALICLLIFFIMLYRNRKVYSGTMQRSNNYWFVFIFMALYSVLGFLEWDTYHYYGMYESTKASGYNLSFEHFFFWLIKTLPESYLLWRVAIWGTASVLMVLSAKRLNINANVFGFMAALMFITQLSVTRGAIGLSLMIFCSILFIQSLDRKKIGLVILAALGIYGSIFMHKSMILFVLLLIGAMFLPLNKRTIIISVILFPFLYGSIMTLTGRISFINQSDWMIDYIEREKTEMNLNGFIMTFFRSALYILLVFHMGRKYLYEKRETSKPLFFLYKYSYILIYVSFLFMGQATSGWISDRSLHAASFPLVLCASNCFDNNLDNTKRITLEKVLIIGFFISTFWKQLIFLRMYWS